MYLMLAVITKWQIKKFSWYPDKPNIHVIWEIWLEFGWQMINSVDIRLTSDLNLIKQYRNENERQAMQYILLGLELITL